MTRTLLSGMHCSAVVLCAVLQTAAGVYLRNSNNLQEDSSTGWLWNETSTPWVPRVPVVSYDPGRSEFRLPMGGSPGYFVKNIIPDALRKWKLSDKIRNVKFDLYKRRLEEAMKLGQNKSLIIFADRDVMYGGCSHDQLVARYNETVKDNAGAKVIWGAQLGFWPPQAKQAMMGKYAGLAQKRKSALTKRGLSDAKFSEWADCSDADAECAKPTPTYSFMNSGFVMGPVDELLKQVTCMLDGRPEEGTPIDEGQRAAECMLKHGDRASLDFAGRLVLSTWEFKNHVIKVEKEGSLVRNNITGEVQCFVHMNGNDDEGKSPYRKRLTREGFNRALSPAHFGVWWSGTKLH